jgi:transcriptional regulator with XRE-family HTH domain
MGRLLEVFSTNLQRFRKDAGLSQDELANKIDVARNTIARYETGESAPSFDAIEKLSEALGLDETTLVTDPEVIYMWNKVTDMVNKKVEQAIETLANAKPDEIKIVKTSKSKPVDVRKIDDYPKLIKSKQTLFQTREKKNK